ncbi:hypothetical protein, conserved [Angomonas deanei]|uniref:Uncharacterized protein n=1 Tax=Angomonas deanei TaxID=59799 RepID=A0A7G2CT64_9TRYP|nr:hypothetical protein, conserved [Angomonas deanei]
MCPGEYALYRKALDNKGSRGLLNYAISGPCFTVVAQGYTKSPVDEGCLALANIASSIRGMENRERLGSVKRGKMLSTKLVSQMESANTDEDEETRERNKAHIEKVRRQIPILDAVLANPREIPEGF